MAESKLKVADKEEQIPEAIKGIFRLYGLNILTDRQKFAALLTDVVSYPFAIKMLKKICMCKELESLVGASRQDVNTIKEAIVNNLYNNEMIAKEATEKALNWIFVALDLVDAGELKSSISLPTTAGVNEDVDLNDFIIGNGVLLKYVGTKIVVNIPDGVVEIGQYAFSPDKLEGTSAKETVLLNLRSVTIPDSVKIINENAFYGCSQLRDIKGSAVEEIGSKAFCGCKALEKFDFGNLKKIGKYAFYECSSLKSIVIPEGVSKIEDETFSGCLKLESVDLGKVKEIGQGAFRGWHLLKSIVIPEGVSKIEAGMFAGCSNLESVDLGNVKEIGWGAFRYCSSLKSIVIPEGVSKIENGTFEECSNLESVDLGKVKEIGRMAFRCCSSLKSIVIPEGVSKIEDGMFVGCSNLESVDLGNVKEIGFAAFSECSSLKSIVIPEGVTRINDKVFYGCVSLESILLPKTLESIGSGAFSGCSKLKHIYYKRVKREEEKQFPNDFFYSETRPTKKGNFWHYVDGKPEAW